MLSLAVALTLSVVAEPVASTPGLLARDVPRAARLLELPGTVLGAAPVFAGPQGELDMLRAEVLRLETHRPTMTVPIVLLAVGGGVAIIGVLGLAFAAGDSSAILGGVVLLIGGVATAVVGGILLALRFGQMAEHDRRLGEAKARLKELEQGGGIDSMPMGPSDGSGPPPPPPTPNGLLNVPTPTLALAQF